MDLKTKYLEVFAMFQESSEARAEGNVKIYFTPRSKL
jgi:hypothetical protein